MDYILFYYLGACFGSFALCIGARIIQGRSPFGRSKSDCCNKSLSLLSLVPIFSFVFARGRCLVCQKKIQKSYVVFELVSGGLLLLLYMKYWGSIVNFTISSIMFALLSIQSASDIEEMMTYDVISYLCGVFAAIFAYLNGVEVFLIVMRIFGMFGFLITLKLIYLKIKKINPLGTGDVILFTSLAPVMNLFFLSCFFFLVGLFGILVALLYLKSFESSKPFPFFPSISIAFLLSLAINY